MGKTTSKPCSSCGSKADMYSRECEKCKMAYCSKCKKLHMKRLSRKLGTYSTSVSTMLERESSHRRDNSTKKKVHHKTVKIKKNQKRIQEDSERRRKKFNREKEAGIGERNI